jgi:hypothetical protein
MNPNYAEVEGINEGIKEVLGDNVKIDLVSIKAADVKLFRSRGKYPICRGSLLTINDKTGVLYTTGYIPYYDTFPGVYIPHGLSINLFQNESSLKTICKEILALTKLNFNNCNYFDSLPITIRFAKKVGEILQYFPSGVEPPNKYFYYM